MAAVDAAVERGRGDRRHRRGQGRSGRRGRRRRRRSPAYGAVRRRGARAPPATGRSASTPGGPRSGAPSARPGADLLNDAWQGFDPASPWSPPSSAPAWSAPRRRPAAAHRPAPGRLRRRRRRRRRHGDRRSPSGRSPPAYGGTGSSSTPAHDFGKNTYHSLEVTRRLDELVATGWPVLVSVSNKDFVGETLDVDKDDRLEATLADDGGQRVAGRAGVPRAPGARRPGDVLDTVGAHPRHPAAGRRPPRAA